MYLQSILSVFGVKMAKWFSLEGGYDEPISSDLEINSVN
jgi:hypothetical protein